LAPRTIGSSILPILSSVVILLSCGEDCGFRKGLSLPCPLTTAGLTDFARAPGVEVAT
jgi:hypothetical protein